MSEAPAADYAVCIMEALSQSPGLMGISDISRTTGINKNAVSRVLGSLTRSGWVYQEGVRYQLSLKPFRVASSALHRNSFFAVAQPVLIRLWEQTGDSCYLGILHDSAVLYLAHMDSTHDLKISGRVGSSYPLDCTAPGNVLLAYASPAFRQTYCQGVLGSQSRIAALEAKLAKVRETGWATDVEEYGPGILCFAAPVFDIHNQVAGTIGVSTSTVYCDEAALIAHQGQMVLAAAREISEKLGAESARKGEIQ